MPSATRRRCCATRPPRQRAEQVGRQLRCLVCQNESIEDSGADLARDLRQVVRQRVTAGDSDSQITAWMVARYGDFVRLRPPFNAVTAVLWLSPVLAVAAALALAVLGRRTRPCPRRRRCPKPSAVVWRS